MSQTIMINIIRAPSGHEKSEKSKNVFIENK